MFEFAHACTVGFLILFCAIATVVAVREFETAGGYDACKDRRVPPNYSTFWHNVTLEKSKIDGKTLRLFWQFRRPNSKTTEVQRNTLIIDVDESNGHIRSESEDLGPWVNEGTTLFVSGEKNVGNSRTDVYVSPRLHAKPYGEIFYCQTFQYF